MTQHSSWPFHCPRLSVYNQPTFDHQLLFAPFLLNCCTFPSDLEHAHSCSLHWPSVSPSYCLEAWMTVYTHICILLQWLVISQIKQLDTSGGGTAAMLSKAWEGGGGAGVRLGEIPATCENSQTQTITEGQPGYQEAEVELEQAQVRGDPYSKRDSMGHEKPLRAVLRSTAAFVNHKS